MSYSTVSYGSSGEEVKKLQRALNSKGYSLSVDGVFGKNTQSAVRDYQQKNGLAVDGIVGAKTWGSLNSASGSGSSDEPKNMSVTASEPVRPQYVKSNAVTSAENKLNQWEQSKPPEYESKYSEKIEELLDGVLNRDKFSYDLSSDPMYGQYRDLYIKNGKKAMQDTIGEATALTGGYANSYAETVGYEAYDEYLDELNGIALDLRDRAYETYKDDGNKLVSDVALLRSLDGDDYERYLSVLERYYEDGAYLLERLSQMSDDDFEKFLAEVDAWESDRDYQREQDEFRQEMDFKKSEAERDQANADRDYYLALSRVSSGGSDNGNDEDSNSGNEYVVYPTSYEEFAARTGYGGIMTENLFMASSAMINKYGTYENYLKEMYKKYA